MGLDSKITNKYTDGHVKVEIGSRNNTPKYYKVPENNADEFIQDYKKNKKKMDWTYSGIMLGAIIAVLVPLAHFTRNIKNQTVKLITEIAAGVAGGVCAIFLSNKIEQNSHTKLMNKYNAKEVS